MWVGGTVSKNDGDIAEFFVRSNARTLDHLIILDESEDSSPAIFNKLRQEGHSLEVINRKSLGLNQVEGINEAMRRAKLLDPSGVFVPLDMDEVLTFRGSDEELRLAKREFSTFTSPNWFPLE